MGTMVDMFDGLSFILHDWSHYQKKMTKTEEERLQNVGGGSFVKKKLERICKWARQFLQHGFRDKNSSDDDPIPIITFMGQPNDQQRIFQFSKLIRMWEQTD